MQITRRTMFIYAAALGLPETLLGTALDAQPAPVRIRQNIQNFVKDPQKVAALRAGVAKMKARSQANQDDPLGWYYWSAVHGTTANPGNLQNVYNQCQHTSFQSNPLKPAQVAQHFVSWHRPFLYFFEAALKQAAQEAGATTSFELSYWNWYADGDLPTIFTEGTEATNPLWHSRENESVDSTALDRSAFNQNSLLPSTIPQWRKSFSVPFELDPRGTVHDLVGGDMGDIQTSARDPIFWVHHANIDRLWVVWTKMKGHANPAGGSSWAATSFTYDQAGQMKEIAGEIVDTVPKLGYRYEEEGPLPAAKPLATAAVLVQSGPSLPSTQQVPSSAMATVSATESVTLGANSVAVNLELPQTARTQLHKFTTSIAATEPGAITGAWLVLDDVKIGADGTKGGFSFNIFVALPNGALGSRQVKVGQLGKFTWPTARADHAHGGQPQPVTLTIPLKDVLGELGLSNPTELEKGLRVVFQAVHREKPGQPPRQFVTVGSISIKTTTAQLQ